MKTQVRNFPTEVGEKTVKPGEGPSLLFYYIFDDWATHYGLIIRKKDSYSYRLGELRESMLFKPQVSLIDSLHRLGRELAVLKRLYQSYELIVMRILHRQRLLLEESRNGPQGMKMIRPLSRAESERPLQHESHMWLHSDDDISNPLVGGIMLRSAATSRFERLAHRIRLYALSEIEECLTEKESLTFLVFNLIAIKDSQAVERLTRTTILLAKVTILFLPVSLMTGYFSTEIKDLQGAYTAKTYWVTFAVIMVLSILGLLVFGRISDTVEGKPIYRSIEKTFFDSLRRRKKAKDIH